MAVKEKIFDANEFQHALKPIWDKLNSLDPEANPFRAPVDPIQLNIPDYFAVIKKPMDLETIRKKLDQGRYHNPTGRIGREYDGGFNNFIQSFVMICG